MLLLKQMMHPLSRTGLKAVLVIFFVGWIAMIVSWTNIKLKLCSSLRNVLMALFWITWTTGNERIPLSDKATSLGIVLDQHMSFDHHVKHIMQIVTLLSQKLLQDQKVYILTKNQLPQLYTLLKLNDSFLMDHPIIIWANFNCSRTWLLVL